MISHNDKKRNYLLQGGITNYSIHEKNKFKSDHTGLFSLTSAKIAEELTNNIINLFPKNYNISITDSTASVGGNTIPWILVKNFYNVNAVEIDKERFEMLKFNINIKTPHINGSYQLYNNSYLNIKNVLNEDIIFIDPPWGGPDYYKQDKIKLFLDDIHLAKIVNSLFTDKGELTYILIKTPKNFDINDFTNDLLNTLSIENFVFSNKLKKINFFFIKRI